MILSRLSSYLRERHRASIADMANGLDSTVGALESMLATLERKGRVRRVAAAAGCVVGVVATVTVTISSVAASVAA